MTARPLTTALVLAATSLGTLAASPSTVHAAPAETPPASISASDPAGDVVVDGDLEPLLGSSEVHDAADLTSVSGDVTDSTYTIRATTVGPMTGASDLLFLTGEVTYDLTWSTVTRRGEIAEIPESVRLTVSSDGVVIERVSLPPRCRNATGFSVTSTEAAGGGQVTVTVPRSCAKGTSGVPLGIADIRVTTDGFGPLGTTSSSYSDDASVTGVARLSGRR